MTDKLANWSAHVCREDDDPFNNILNIGKDFDEGFLHVDVEKKRQWKKYEEEKRINPDADEDYKELARLGVYDHVSNQQRVYFANVNKPNPRLGTLEFIS